MLLLGSGSISLLLVIDAEMAELILDEMTSIMVCTMLRHHHSSRMPLQALFKPMIIPKLQPIKRIFAQSEAGRVTHSHSRLHVTPSTEQVHLSKVPLGAPLRSHNVLAILHLLHRPLADKIHPITPSSKLDDLIAIHKPLQCERPRQIIALRL